MDVAGEPTICGTNRRYVQRTNRRRWPAAVLGFHTKAPRCPALCTQCPRAPVVVWRIRARSGTVCRCKEIRTELQKQWSEVAVYAIEVVVVHEGSGLHNPREFRSGLRVVALLSSIHPTFFLRLADEDNAFFGFERATKPG